MSGETGVALVGDWSKAFQLLKAAPKRIEKALNQQVLQEAHRLRAEIVQAFDRGGSAGGKWRGYSKNTLIVRRFLGIASGKLLIQSSALRNSIVVIPVGKGVAFVGVRRRSGGKGKRPANLAEIHEQGRTWTMTMTPKMRRFLWAALWSSGVRARPRAKGQRGPNTITITIPARPFIGPAIKNMKVDEIRARFVKAIQEALRV